MTVPSQQYAHLAGDAYKDYRVGAADPNNPEYTYADGVKYVVLEHARNSRSGYQGTIYQNASTGEIVVAHRGTEFDNEPFRDGLLADGSMVFSRANPQVPDAIALTRKALEYAERQEARTGHAPEVTVTGHSLGGALAQASAHHFDLKGETFNAYGAASLGYRIPEGGNSVLNHVMASDPVSAAARHYGQVRIYATEQEINRLGNGGFSNSRYNGLIPDTALGVAAFSFDAHKMHNFLPVDADGRPDRSILADPQARQRAQDNQRMIGEYRSDMLDLREGVTRGARGPIGNAIDAIDSLRGPVQPGEPARREQRDDRSSLRMDDPRHGGHSLYQDAERGVHALDAKVGRAPDQQSRQLAGVLAAEMHSAGGQRIDAVVLGTDGSRAFAVQGRVDDPAHLRVNVATTDAMQTPLENSTQRMDQSIAQQQALTQQQSQQQERQQGPHGRAMA